MMKKIFACLFTGIMLLIGTLTIAANDTVSIVQDKNELPWDSIPEDKCHTLNNSNIIITEAIPPTCAKPGRTESSYCSVCRKVIKPQEDLKELGHAWSSWKTYKSATVFATGVAERKCSRCKKIEKKTIAKLRATIILKESSFKLQSKKSVLLTPYITGLAKGDSIASWTSSNTKIAMVKAGKVYAGKKTGTAIITVKTKAGAVAKFVIKVQKGVVKTTSLIVNKKSISLAVNKTVKLVARVEPVTSTQKITYRSSNRNVAVVSSKGIITAKKKGITIVTVESGNKRLKVKVKVH